MAYVNTITLTSKEDTARAVEYSGDPLHRNHAGKVTVTPYRSFYHVSTSEFIEVVTRQIALRNVAQAVNNPFRVYAYWGLIRFATNTDLSQAERDSFYRLIQNVLWSGHLMIFNEHQHDDGAEELNYFVAPFNGIGIGVEKNHRHYNPQSTERVAVARHVTNLNLQRRRDYRSTIPLNPEQKAWLSSPGETTASDEHIWGCLMRSSLMLRMRIRKLLKVRILRLDEQRRIVDENSRVIRERLWALLRVKIDPSAVQLMEAIIHESPKALDVRELDYEHTKEIR